MSSGPSAWKRFILWDYRRASWQYDVMVALILAFIFLTPRELFRDGPRPSNIVLLPAVQGTTVYWLAPDLLANLSEAERPARASALLATRSGGRAPRLVRLEPLTDSEREVSGYMAFVEP